MEPYLAAAALPPPPPEHEALVVVGLGRIVALYDHSSTLYQIR